MEAGDIKAIRLEMKEDGISRAQFAALMGVALRTTYKWDNGERKIGPSAAMLLGLLVTLKRSMPGVFEEWRNSVVEV